MKTAEMNHRFVTRNMVNQLAPVDTGINAVEVQKTVISVRIPSVCNCELTIQLEV